MKLNLLTTLILKTLGFFLIWLLLSESFLAIHMLLGLLAAFAVAWLNTERSAIRFTLLRWSLVWYFPYLLGKVLQSGFHLSLLILNPSLPIDPKMVSHNTTLTDESGIVLLGNSITLTPGTITVEVKSRQLLVHAMDDASAKDVTEMRLERRIVRAVGEDRE